MPIDLIQWRRLQVNRIYLTCHNVTIWYRGDKNWWQAIHKQENLLQSQNAPGRILSLQRFKAVKISIVVSGRDRPPVQSCVCSRDITRFFLNLAGGQSRSTIPPRSVHTRPQFSRACPEGIVGFVLIRRQIYRREIASKILLAEIFTYILQAASLFTRNHQFKYYTIFYTINI